MVKLHLEHQYEMMKDPQVREILKNGYVLNVRLCRRWMPMQFFRLYENAGSVSQMDRMCGNKHYGAGAPYSITKKFRLWCAEIHRLHHLYVNDFESYRAYVALLSEDLILQAGKELLDMMNPYMGDTYIGKNGQPHRISEKQQESNACAAKLKYCFENISSLYDLFKGPTAEAILENIKYARRLRKQNLTDELNMLAVTTEPLCKPMNPHVTTPTLCWDIWYLNTGAYYTLRHITTFLGVDPGWIDWDAKPMDAFAELVQTHPDINAMWYASKMDEVLMKQGEYTEKGEPSWGTP